MIEEHQRLPGSIFRCIQVSIDNIHTLFISEEFWIDSGQNQGFIGIEEFWPEIATCAQTMVIVMKLYGYDTSFVILQNQIIC